MTVAPQHLAGRLCWLSAESAAGIVNQSTDTCHLHVIWVSLSMAAMFGQESVLRDLGRNSKASSSPSLKVPRYHFCHVLLLKQLLTSASIQGPPLERRSNVGGSSRLGDCLLHL